MPREPALDLSLWHATAARAPQARALEANTQADVAIVGGGFTGCSAALHLASKGKSVVLLEAKEFGWGGSGRNAGLVNAGLWLSPDDVVQRVGNKHGELLVQGLNTAPRLVYETVDKYQIQCDLVRKGVIQAAFNSSDYIALCEHVRQWQTRGAPIELLDAEHTKELLGTTRYHGALIDHRSASIQPLSYVRGLAHAAQSNGARLYTKSPVIELERRDDHWRVVTAGGAVTAEHVILATNAYSDDLWPGLRESTIPAGAFMYATGPLGENIRTGILPGGHAMFDTQPAMNFARLDRDYRLIVGSLGYLPGSNPQHHKAWINRVLKQLFPELGDTAWHFQWAGTIGFTPDHIPRLHEPAPNLHMTVGYNGRGIAPGTFWGKQLAERIADGKPDDEMPLPVTPVRPIRGRFIWRMFYEAAFSAYRLRT